MLSNINMMKQAEILGKTCQSASMPNLSNLKMSDYNLVYEPSEDTFLLLDALFVEFDDDNSKQRFRPRTSLEIGCGTGVASIFLAKLFSSKETSSMIHLMTDINIDAIRISLKTFQSNGLTRSNSIVEAVKCDLATSFLPRFLGSIDLLLFNPPYVPTPNDEIGSCGIEASWAGGENGRVVIDRTLVQISQLLSYPNGRAYMVVVDENKPFEIMQIMKEKYSIQVTPFIRRKARNEYLTILKMTPTKPPCPLLDNL